MAEWIECTIGDLCDTISERYRGNDEYVVLVNTSDVLEGKILNHTQVPNKNLKGQFKKTFRKNDILFSEIRPANKRFAFIDFENTSNYIASTKLMVLRHNEKVLPEYLFAILKSNYILAELQHLAETRSGTFPQITFTSELAHMKVNLPDKKTQKRIVSVLSSIEQKMDTNEIVNDNLEQQAQALFKSWFVEFELFNGTMPSDWEIVPLKKIADFQNGYAFKSKELLSEPSPDCYQVFKQGHIARGGGFIPDGTKSWYPKSIASKLEKFVLKKGDILMAMTDMKDNVAILGNTAVMPLDNEYIVNQRVGHLRANGYKGVTYPFIYLLTNSTDFLVDLRSRANSGVQVNLSSSEVKASQTVLPSEEVNNAFSEITLPMFEIIINNQLENQRLAQLRDTLLPKLMSGELDVSDIDL